MIEQLVIKNEISELEKLANFIEEIGKEQELDLVTVMNLNLVLEEVVSNIIMYGYPTKMGDEIIICSSMIDLMLVVTILDNGLEFDPTQMKEADITLSAEERSIGGLGIFIVRKIMDEMSYERVENRNVLTLKKKIQK